MSEILTILATMGIIFVLLVLAIYVVNALVTMNVLKKLSFQYPWMAWIPYVGTIALGLTCDEGDQQTEVFGHRLPTIAVALFPVIALAVGYIPILGTLLSLAVNVILGGTVYTIVYSRMEGKPRQDCMILGLVSGLIPVIAFVKFILYKLRGNAPGEL